MKKIWYAIQNFFLKINNLIVWFPVIWEDQQFDHDYLLRILRKKLFLMEQFQRSSDAQHLYALKDAESIHVATSTLDRLISCNYLEEYLEEYYSQYPDRDWLKFKESEDHPGYSELYDEMTPEQSELYMKCTGLARKMEDEDYNFLFDHLKAHIREWWD